MTQGGEVSERQDAIRVRINGEDRTVPRGLDVRSLLERLGVTPELVVVERNLEILERDRYESVIVEEGDALEVVHFVGGG
jgi:thiamine biosynthesis protein ThiS